MGFSVTESLEFSSLGVSLPGVDCSLLGNYEVHKVDEKYNVEAYARVYASTDHTKSVLDVIGVKLVLDSLPDNVFTALYAALKANSRFTGKTLVDN